MTNNKMNDLNRYVSAAVLVLTLSATSANVIAQQTSSEELLNFEVVETGVYQVSYADLDQYGLDIRGVPLDQLALTNKGEPVALELVGSDANPNVFGEGGRIRFVGQGLDTLYTDTNVYTLQINPAAQLLIDSQAFELPTNAPFANTYLATKTYGPQNEYFFASPNANDPWFAERVLALDESASTTINMDLPDYAEGGNTGTTVANMRVDVWGASDLIDASDDHHVQVRFNGVQVLDETFDGFARKRMTGTVSNLRQGNNQVQINLPLDQGNRFDAINVDTVTVNYPRAFVAQENRLNFTSTFNKFRIRGFTNEQVTVYRSSGGTIGRLVNAQSVGNCSNGAPRCAVQFGSAQTLAEYFVLTDDSVLKPTLAAVPLEQDIRSGNAEYLIITHPDFIAEANEVNALGQLEANLLESFNSVDIVDVEQIYAQFGHHVYDPTAIKDYLAFANQNRGTRMVLLVGGDVFDYRGFQNQNAQSFIPSIYRATDEVINFAPVDASYVDFDDDDVPDIPIGRLPITSTAELNALIEKRRIFLERSYPQTGLFSADGFDEVQNYDFKADSESVRQAFFPTWDIQGVYLDDVSVTEAREQVASRINQGVSLTSFFGHSSTTQWTFDGLFNGFDVANLNNPDRPTVVTQWGCWNTYYVNPNEESLGRRFMANGNRGAVAVMGATTLTSARNESILSKLLYQRLAEGETLGDAMTNAKAEMAIARPGALDVILGWSLLGFPELTM